MPEVPEDVRLRIRWVRRSKKGHLPPGADEADRAKYAKMRDYLLRVDDDVTCKTCGKKFEIPVAALADVRRPAGGLPNDDELEREIAAASGEPEPPREAKPALPSRLPASNVRRKHVRLESNVHFARVLKSSGAKARTRKCRKRPAVPARTNPRKLVRNTPARVLMT